MKLFSLGKKEDAPALAQDEDPSNEKDTVPANIENRDVEATHARSNMVEIDPVLEKRVRRKLDRRIVPLVAALYLLAFLDRSNIGYVGHVHLPWSID